jgi:uncharacterized protein (DUF1697 family)
MTTYIGLLRGINVGGNKLLKMETLRAICESSGLRNVRTYLQSGNVLFDAPKPPKLEEAIRKETGMDVAVILRTAAEMRRVVEHNPFDDFEPAKLQITFLREPTKAQLPDGWHLIGRDIYAYFPEGMGRSKLVNVLTEKKLGTVCTTRNWNTVVKLAELAEG